MKILFQSKLYILEQNLKILERGLETHAQFLQEDKLKEIDKMALIAGLKLNNKLLKLS